MSEEKQTKVSLIVPVYNVEKYLEKCLESSLCQTYRNYEVILVNDGSTDSSGQICREYARRDARICFVQKENGGLVSAWMEGLKESSGDYVAFLDSDDWVEPDYLEQLVSGTKTGAEIVCCNKMLEYGTHNVLLKEALSPGCYGEETLFRQVFPVLLNDGTYLGRGVTPHRCGKLFAKDILQRNLKYCDKSISYGEDLNLVFPALLDCKKLQILDDCRGLYHYRQNRESMLHSYKKNMFPQIRKLYRNLTRVNSEKQGYDFMPQLYADYLSMFLEYVKNETKRDAFPVSKAKDMIRDYVLMREDMGRETNPSLELKFSDRILLTFLNRKLYLGVYIWLLSYRFLKICTRGTDLKYRKIRKKTEKRKIRVLMVGPDSSVKGGIHTVADQYLTWPYWGQIELIYIPTYIEKTNFHKIAFFLVGFLRIFLLCMTKRVEVVHLHVSERKSFYRKGLILLFCGKMKIRTVLHHHGAEFMEFYEAADPRTQRWIKKVMESADVNLVLSQYHKVQMEKRFPHAVFRVLYNTVKVCEKNPYHSEVKGILFVGRLGKRKGVYDLLQAVKECDRILAPAVKLYLCGDGEIRGVKDAVKKLRLQHRIAHIGWCSTKELEQIYAKTMLFVLPSYHEGLPMALLEAMSHGIPCIGSKVDAIPETIEDGRSGLLVQAGDIAGIREAILRLVQDEQLRIQMGQRSYEVIREKFDIRKGMAEVKELYETLTREER